MTTLQKFKFLAVRCIVAESPSRSPSRSPGVHLRRRRRITLKNLLKETAARGKFFRQIAGTPDPVRRVAATEVLYEKGDKEISGRTLKDLFVSSPENRVDGSPEKDLSVDVRRMDAVPVSGIPVAGRNFLGLRQRLLRRAWRPVLVAIPE